MNSARSSRRVSDTPRVSHTPHTNTRDNDKIMAQWKQQLSAYVQWMNSQLKKKPGAHLVEDLRLDVRDGVALLDLLEVIAGEKLADVHPAPSTLWQMRANVDQVLQFMNKHKIKMHTITTRDIVDGNLKAIMRLILALAAHYKPNSVRHSHQSSKSGLTGLAQGAAAALTEARRNANRAGHRYRRRRPKEDKADGSDSDQAPTPSSKLWTPMVTPHSHRHRRSEGEGHAGHYRGHGGQGRAELEGASSSPPSSQNASPRTSLYVSDPPGSTDGLLFLNGNGMMTSCESDNNLTDSGFQEMCHSVQDTHQMLFQLHELLLNGDVSDKSKTLPLSDEDELNHKESNVILKARLLHTEEVTQGLRSDLARTKQDCLELQGTKAGLQQRLIEQDVQLSGAKGKLMEVELEKDKMQSELESLRKQLKEREQVLSDVKLSFVKQVEEKDRIIGELRNKLMDVNTSHWNGNTPTKDRGPMSPHRQTRRGSYGTRSSAGRGQSVTRNTNQNASQSGSPSTNQAPPLPPPRATPTKQGRSQIPVPNSPRGKSLSPNQTAGKEVSTQVIYFIEGSDRPLNCVIRKKLGDIRLRDLKAVVVVPPSSSQSQTANGQTHATSGQTHFFFKALDPEYGTVKEELCNDDDVLPGWEGKIVAWLEVEKSTMC